MILPLALYIHIPWCVKKCPYCDFNSHKSPATLPEISYIKRLLHDLDEDLQRFPAREMTSIFIGGGTPSLFSAKAYDLLFNELKKRLLFSSDIEITLEANPGTVEQYRFYDYRMLGINRLSLGIQSFNPIHLKQLGRIHDDRQAHAAIESAKLAGFDNINIDIMHSLPRQTLAECLNDLQTAISYHPTHLSWYQLTIEPNTTFHKKPPVLPPENQAHEMEQEGLALLATKQFNRYEISAFCKNNFKSKHNLNYWHYGDYYGIGAGAHGKLTTADHAVWRTKKQRQPLHYLDSTKPCRIALERVKKADLLFEFMLNTSRLEAPVAKQLFTDCTGLPYECLAQPLEKAKALGLINIGETHWQITPFGRRYTNNLQALFLP